MLHTDPFELLLEALRTLLCDDGFSITSPPAVAALKTATNMLSWCSDPANHLVFAEFSTTLKTKLDAAFHGASRCKFQTKKERMWSNFHTIRCSDEFRRLWNTFLLQSLKSEVSSPIFYQYITDKFFRQLIALHFPTQDNMECSGIVLDSLTYEELNVLRYGAGYVCRALRKKVSAKPNKKELLLSLDELLEDQEENGSYDPTKDWIDITNRGGLLYVSDEAFRMFCAIEEVVRQHFRKDSAKDISTGMKKELCDRITSNEFVTSSWEVVAVDMDRTVGKQLLNMIVDLWVTVRGFSFAGAWLELYKQRTKKNLQCSKGLRKVLYTQPTD
ncbi:hypothetical protein SPONN_2632 [uncultured Candidatus Thioglobus sp.]|nr:hypothetical protein SPONN_2632 [uncultured Candidatus Thioglobus sp.]